MMNIIPHPFIKFMDGEVCYRERCVRTLKGIYYVWYKVKSRESSYSNYGIINDYIGFKNLPIE